GWGGGGGGGVLEVTPKGEKKGKNITVKLGEYQETIPAELPKKASLEKALQKPGTPPPPKGDKKDEKEEKKEDKEKEKAKTGLFSRQNAARDRTYWVYVPDDYDPNISYALVIWLHPVNKNKKEDLEKLTDLWEDFCSENRVIIVAPKSEHETGWVASEAEFIQEATRGVMEGYTIDRRRVVTHGMGVGGQMAYYMGFAARDLVRGVATTGAVLTTSPKERVATQPLSFFLIVGEKDPIKEAVKASQDKLREHRYPVIYRELTEKGHQYFDDDSKKTFEELVRWIDSLDRI